MHLLTCSVEIFLVNLTYTRYFLINRKFQSINFIYYNNPGLAKPLPLNRQGKLWYWTAEPGRESCPTPSPSNFAICKKGRTSRQGRHYITALILSMNSKTWIFQLSHWHNQPRSEESKEKPAVYIKGATESPLSKSPTFFWLHWAKS